MRGDVEVSAAQNAPPRATASPIERVRVSALEADLAYFEARLALVGHPASTNQQAQVRAFRILNQTITRTLHRVKRKQALNGAKPGLARRD